MMQLLKYDHYKTIEIWTPRGHDDMVLINASQLNKALKHYRIVFIKNKARAGKQYYLPLKAIKKAKKEWHKAKDGRDILRYAVPVSRLEDLEINEQDLRSIW